MPGRRRRGWRGRAIADHDIAGLKLGLAQGLAELRGTGAQLRRGGRPLRPHPHRRALAAQRDQRMDRSGGLDVERESCPPDPLGCRDLAAAAVARDFELRNGRSLRRRKRNFKTPARRGGIQARARGIDAIRQGGHLQQGLPRNGGVGIAEQLMRTCRKRRIGSDRRWRDRLRRRQCAAKRRWRRVGMDGDVVVADIRWCRQGR